MKYMRIDLKKWSQSEIIKATIRVCPECQGSFRCYQDLVDHVLEMHPQILDRNCDICDERHLIPEAYKLHFLLTHGNCIKEEKEEMVSEEQHGGKTQQQIPMEEYSTISNDPLELLTNNFDSKPHSKLTYNHSQQVLPLINNKAGMDAEKTHDIGINSTNGIEFSDQDQADDQSHVCHDCDAQFSKRSFLRSHVKLAHTKPQPNNISKLQTHKIKKSTKGFANRGALKKLNRAKRISQQQYGCKLCDLSFDSKFIRNQHVLNNHPDCAFHVCNECGRRFLNKQHLKGHVRFVHSDHRPFVCEQCGQSFKLSRHLQRHIRSVHDNIRPFVCDKCNLGFKEKTALHFHRASDHKNRCKDCSLRFVLRSALEKHVKEQHEKDNI